MLILIRQRVFNIGNTNEINEILRCHNSGIGSQTSHLLHLFPYSVFTYICGFNGNQSLMYYIEYKWKDIVRLLRY